MKALAAAKFTEFKDGLNIISKKTAGAKPLKRIYQIHVLRARPQAASWI